MAIKGLSKPVCANYTAVGNAVTYSDAYAADKAVEYSFEADVAEDKDLYADNQVAETAAGRAGGYESPSGGGARRRAAEAG